MSPVNQAHSPAKRAFIPVDKFEPAKRRKAAKGCIPAKEEDTARGTCQDAGRTKRLILFEENVPEVCSQDRVRIPPLNRRTVDLSRQFARKTR